MRWLFSITIFFVYILVFAIIYAYVLKNDFRYANYDYEPGYLEHKREYSELLEKIIRNGLQNANKSSGDTFAIHISDLPHVTEDFLSFGIEVSFYTKFSPTLQLNNPPFVHYHCQIQKLESMKNNKLHGSCTARDQSYFCDHCASKGYKIFDYLISNSDASALFDLITPETYIKEGIFLRMMYFSIVTATTLGYGDITPITNRARVAIAIESFFGLVMLGWIVSRHTNRQ